jgi:UDP-glucuronate 4-epimerase
MRTILITGGAGFLGYHIAKRLLADPDNFVVLVDNMNSYYSTVLKHLRLDLNQVHTRCKVYRHDISDEIGLNVIFYHHTPEIVIHLAAQAGVRYSEVNPIAYAKSNMLGTTVVFDVAKKNGVKHILYASSSSVYGGLEPPFSEDMPLVQPLSFYAVSKQTNEMTASNFTSLTGIPTTGLRFFTAYGPYGRPDMAYWKFTDNILKSQPITLYGDVMRDFTYCDDVAIAVEKLMAVPNGHQVFNVGNSQPVLVRDMITCLEERLNMTAIVEIVERPASDPLVTACVNTRLQQAINWVPDTPIAVGLNAFVTWYLEYKDLI